MSVWESKVEMLAVALLRATVVRPQRLHRVGLPDRSSAIDGCPDESNARRRDRWGQTGAAVYSP